MEQSSNINRLFHTRMIGVSVVLASADAYMVYSAATKLMASGPSLTLPLLLLTSFTGTFAVVSHAFHLKRQFYPA